jgi:iron complex transport system ATP-binding protein
VRWAIDSVGAELLAGRVVSSLSDGERQKILIARALAQEPDLMLLDEPGAYLDLPRRVEIMGLLRDLAHDSGRSILASTHDLDLALRCADRIWLMRSDGIFASGAPEDLVLNGAFAAAFDKENIHFEAQSGAFVVRQETRGSVSLHGSGLNAIWTRRALERAGFAIASNGAKHLAQVEVCADHWQVILADRAIDFPTLQAVLDQLAPLRQSAPPHS